MSEPQQLELAKRLRGIGVSAPYASQIAKGSRAPSLALALRIHKALSIKLGPIAGTPDEDIEVLARHRGSQSSGAA